MGNQMSRGGEDISSILAGYDISLNPLDFSHRFDGANLCLRRGEKRTPCDFLSECVFEVLDNGEERERFSIWRRLACIKMVILQHFRLKTGWLRWLPFQHHKGYKRGPLVRLEVEKGPLPSPPSCKAGMKKRNHSTTFQGGV